MMFLKTCFNHAPGKHSLEYACKNSLFQKTPEYGLHSPYKPLRGGWFISQFQQFYFNSSLTDINERARRVDLAGDRHE